MPRIHFFADQAAIAKQQGDPGDEAFGPTTAAPATKFRVTSLHKGKGATNPIAYAVCRGAVRAQADVNSSLLTLVLRPDAEILPGVPISYFVYRGIRRNSLISGGELKNGIALTEKLLNDPLPAGDPLKKSPDRLGLAFHQAATGDLERLDSDAIDTLFFESTDLKPILVDGGDTLGEFDNAGFGFEIMVRSVWPPPSLGLLRNVPLANATGNLIDVSSLTGAAQRAGRESIYSYLDPCAFYGMCFDHPDGVWYGSGTGPAIAAADVQDLYDKVLANFHNANKISIDLRNDNGMSYNYYDNYGAGEILLDLDADSLKSRQRKNDALVPGPSNTEPYATGDWPLKIIDGTKFKNLQGKKYAGLRLAMNTGSPGSGAVRRRLFYDFARLYYNEQRRRKSEEPLLEPRSNQRLEADLLGNYTTFPIWTRDVVLGVPVVSAGVQGTTPLPIVFHFRLRYLRQNEEQPTAAGRYISTAGQWDNVFVLQTEPSRWKNNHSSNWWLTGHLKYVQAQLDNQQVFDGMVEAGIAVDRDPQNPGEERYTFFYVPIYVVPQPPDYRLIAGTNPAGTVGGGSRTSFFQRTESGTLYDGSCYLTIVKQTEFNAWSSQPVGNQPIDPPFDPTAYLSFLTYLENVRPDDQKEKGSNPFHSKESLYAMSFSGAEYETLLNLIGSNLDPKLHPVFLQVRRRVFPRNDDTATRRAYQALELCLAGFDAAGIHVSLDVPANGSGAVLPLSLPADGMIFCTTDAAAFEPLEVKPDAQICTQVRHESMQGATRTDEHEKDFRYFCRAIADIKRYSTSFYEEMQKLQLLGTEVILHNDVPGTKKRRRYRIKVTFDDWMRATPTPQVTIRTAAATYTEAQVDQAITQPLVTRVAANPPMAGVKAIIGESFDRVSIVKVNFDAATSEVAAESAVKARLAASAAFPAFPTPAGTTRTIDVQRSRDSTGETTGRAFFANFPGEQTARESTFGYQITKLQTLAVLDEPERNAVIAADGYGFGDVETQPTSRCLNESRYVKLNADRNVPSSQVNARFLADYTPAEISANSFDPDKLYIESVWKANGAGKDVPHRITLAELRNLGLGTYDPERPILIRVNREDVNSFAEDETVGGKKSGYHYRRRVVSTNLAHELGHAQVMIQQPLVDRVWLELEEIFDYGLANAPPYKITQLKLLTDATKFASWQLVDRASYPNAGGSPISSRFEREDAARKLLDSTIVDRNQKLRNEFFLTKTGDGHLRGSPSGQRACGVERDVDSAAIAEAVELLAKVGASLTPSFDYCFLNHDDADLNP